MLSYLHVVAFQILQASTPASSTSTSTSTGVTSPQEVLAFMAEIPACEGRVPQCARAGGWDHIGDAKEIAKAISMVARSQEEADRMAIFCAREGGNLKTALGDGGSSKGVVQLQGVPDEVAFTPLLALKAWQQKADVCVCTSNPPDEAMAWAWGSCSYKVAKRGARHREEVRRAIRARLDARTKATIAAE